MSSSSSSSTVATPCVGVCSTVYGDAVCRGCKRFAFEVIRWNTYADPEKAAVVARLDSLLERILGARIEVIDEALLDAELRRRAVRFSPGRPVLHRAGELLRVRADAIQDPADCGLRILSPWDRLPLPRLRDAIEEELLALSEAHLQRFFPADAGEPVR